MYEVWGSTLIVSIKSRHELTPKHYVQIHNNVFTKLLLSSLLPPFRLGYRLHPYGTINVLAAHDRFARQPPADWQVPLRDEHIFLAVRGRQ